MKRFQEEVLIGGLRQGTVVGRVIISRGESAFNTFDRDLLGRFADHLRQRVVDFNREWKHLSLCFPPPVVQRLLAEEGYIERFLRPREKSVAIMFCDISGFTRLSEQLLREPALIGRLIDVWSATAVEIIWETGGVFDKLVGDCVIGLWGPPFHEMDAPNACRGAALAARRIHDFTHRLVELDELPQLRQLERPPGVSTGLNYCPLYVGLFGPNEDYTGFSSGMNNTARLQGVARRDEILCLAPFVEAHGDLELFGPPQEARVKNVEHPLVYRELLG
jgi:class 3 adenylate cyclase